MKCINIFLNFILTIFLFSCQSYTSNPFDDTILYNIKWPGRNPEKIADIVDPNNFEVGTTSLGERYFCFLPAEDKPKNEDSEHSYNGATPFQLLRPMFSQTTCSYRLESYWTYEVCHGKYVKQYHEERDGKKIKRQEYNLGKWDISSLNNLAFSKERQSSPKSKKIEGMEIPYFQLNYTDGTLCDLNEKPRQTNVLYMCFDNARHDIYSIKEISTCLYEAIIFTPVLCSHPAYKPKNSAEKDINCIPFEGVPNKPAKLLTMEADSTKQKQDQLIDDDQVLKKVFAVFSFDKSGGQVDLINFMDDELDGEAQLRVQIHPIDSIPVLNEVQTIDPAELPRKPDLDFDIPSFLSGKNCLEGGKGWWKYEFCYGKHVIQFHEDIDGSRTLIKLGEFSLEDHKVWLENNPNKRPKKKSTTVSHMYSKGSYCETIKSLRETEVRFKCIKENGSSTAIKLYLVEPQTCKYVLYVESSVFCRLISSHMDQDGLFEEIPRKENVIEIEEKIEL